MWGCVVGANGDFKETEHPFNKPSRPVPSSRVLPTARGMEAPFPWLPMLALAIGLVSHSYSLSSLFPYVGYMVQHLGVTDDKDEAGLCYVWAETRV